MASGHARGAWTARGDGIDGVRRQPVDHRGEQERSQGRETKHVDVKYHFITETIESGRVKLQWVQSSEQQADIFTKALPLPAFLKLRKDLMTE